MSEGNPPAGGDAEADRQPHPPADDLMGIINRWVLETAIGGTPLELAGTFVGEIGAALLRGSQSTDPTPDVVLDWAIVKVGAAQVAVPLLERLRKQPDTLVTMLTPLPELIEVVALTLVSTSVLGAFDLCADALYRASGGVPEARGQGTPGAQEAADAAEAAWPDFRNLTALAEESLRAADL